MMVGVFSALTSDVLHLIVRDYVADVSLLRLTCRGFRLVCDGLRPTMADVHHLVRRAVCLENVVTTQCKIILSKAELENVQQGGNSCFVTLWTQVSILHWLLTFSELLLQERFFLYMTSVIRQNSCIVVNGTWKASKKLNGRAWSRQGLQTCRLLFVRRRQLLDAWVRWSLDVDLLMQGPKSSKQSSANGTFWISFMFFHWKLI